MNLKSLCLPCLLLSSSAFSQQLTTIPKPQDPAAISVNYLTKGSWSDYQPGDPTPVVFYDILVGTREDKEIWKALCQQCIYQIIHQGNGLIFLAEQVPDPLQNRTLVALRESDGQEVWRTPLAEQGPGFRNSFITFHGKPAVTQDGKATFEIFDASTGKRLETTVFPQSISPEGLGTWQFFLRYVVGESGTSYWGVPGGKLAAAKGAKELWSVDLHQLLDADDPKSAYSDVYGFFEINNKTVAVLLGVFGDHASVRTPFLDIASGRQISAFPAASSLALDKKTFYLRHLTSVAAYDRKTLKKTWENRSFEPLEQKDNLAVDDAYAYAVNVDRFDQLHVVLMDKMTGKILDDTYVRGQIVRELSLVDAKAHIISVSTQSFGSGEADMGGGNTIYLKVQP